MDVIAVERSEFLEHPVPAWQGHSPANEEIDSTPDGSPPRAGPVPRMRACGRSRAAASEGIECRRGQGMELRPGCPGEERRPAGFTAEGRGWGFGGTRVLRPVPPRSGLGPNGKPFVPWWWCQTASALGAETNERSQCHCALLRERPLRYRPITIGRTRAVCTAVR